MSEIRTTWSDELAEAEDQAARMTAHGGQPSDFESATVAALLAIAKQGERSLAYGEQAIEQTELMLRAVGEIPGIRIRIEALNAALQTFGHVLADAPNTERPAVLAELLGYAEAFAGFLGAQSGQA